MGRREGGNQSGTFFNVAFDKNPQLSGQREVSLFFRLRIQHEAGILQGRGGEKTKSEILHSCSFREKEDAHP